LDISESGDRLSSAPKLVRSPPEYSPLAISHGFRDSLNTASSDQFAVTPEFARAVEEGDADLPALPAGLIGGLILPLALSVLLFSCLSKEAEKEVERESTDSEPIEDMDDDLTLPQIEIFACHSHGNPLDCSDSDVLSEEFTEDDWIEGL
jgi:hypothetical protein